MRVLWSSELVVAGSKIVCERSKGQARTKAPVPTPRALKSKDRCYLSLRVKFAELA